MLIQNLTAFDVKFDCFFKLFSGFFYVSQEIHYYKIENMLFVGVNSFLVVILQVDHSQIYYAIVICSTTKSIGTPKIIVLFISKEYSQLIITMPLFIPIYIFWKIV